MQIASTIYLYKETNNASGVPVPPPLPGFCGVCVAPSFLVFCVVFCRSSCLATVLSVLLQFTHFDYSFDISKLFLGCLILTYNAICKAIKE